MIQRIVAELGPWGWWVIGMVLLAAEILTPGVFFVWIGLGAIATGILSLILWNADLWIWQVQLVVFAALSVASILAGRKLVLRKGDKSDEPLLNQRTASLVGRTATLETPITEGRGRVRLDDTWWSVIGPDLPAGTRIRITAAHGRDLHVESF